MSAARKAADADKPAGRKIKYIGIADRAVLAVGENFGGRLATPLTQEVVWDWGNRHIVDASKVGLSDDALTLLLQDDKRFLDVTDHEVIPLGLHEKVWKAAKEVVAEAKAVVTPDTTETVDESTSAPEDEVAADITVPEGGSAAEAADAEVPAPAPAKAAKK